MAETLPVPATPAQVSRELAVLPVARRAEARQQALGYSSEVLDELRRIATESKSDKDRTAAGKVILAVAALLSSTNIPRDVVKEKWDLTVELVAELLPPERWDEFADRARAIWKDL